MSGPNRPRIPEPTRKSMAVEVQCCRSCGRESWVRPAFSLDDARRSGERSTRREPGAAVPVAPGHESPAPSTHPATSPVAASRRGWPSFWSIRTSAARGRTGSENAVEEVARAEGGRSGRWTRARGTGPSRFTFDGLGRAGVIPRYARCPFSPELEATTIMFKELG
jgi:hypothetical protein